MNNLPGRPPEKIPRNSSFLKKNLVPSTPTIPAGKIKD